MSSSELTCPHCGHMQSDLWDFDWKGDEDEAKEVDCDSCERPLLIHRDVQVTYSVTTVTGDSP